MKKAIIVIFLLILANIFFLLMPMISWGQYSPEVNKMLGIKPRDDKVKINYADIFDLPSDSVLFVSFYNEIRCADKISHQSEISFRFEDRVVTTTMNDQMQKFTLYCEVNRGKDSKHEWRTFSSLDNSGSVVHFTIAKEDTLDIIIIDYGKMFMYFEVTECPLPPKAHDILENIEETLGHLHDGNFGANYTDEQVDEFFGQFGINSKIVTAFIMKEMLYNYENVSNGYTGGGFAQYKDGKNTHKEWRSTSNGYSKYEGGKNTHAEWRKSSKGYTKFKGGKNTHIEWRTK